MKPQPQVENNSSMLGSSAGFTRKIKLAPQRPGSRDQKTKTGEIFPQFQDPLSGNPYNLQVINLYQDENTFISSMKAELNHLQDEINKLDLDGRIRNADPRQEYRLQQLKKWVAQNSSLNIKQIIDRATQAIDLPQLLSVLDTRTPEEGLLKLYRLISILDCMIVKVTEYEAIHMIKFDELFTQLCPNHNDSLQSIQINRFPISFLNLARMTELYQVKQGQDKKTDQSNKIVSDNQALMKTLKMKDDQLTDLNKQIKQLQLQLQAANKQSNNQNQVDSNKQYEEQILILNNEIDRLQNELQQNGLEYQQKQKQYEQQINQQKKEAEKQISDMVFNQTQELKKQKEKFDEQLKISQNQNSQPVFQTQVQTQCTVKDSNYYQKILDKNIAETAEKIKSLENELLKLKNTLTDRAAVIESQQREIQQLKEQIEKINQVKDEIYQNFQKRYSTKDEFANSYEAALKLEFDAMKKSFEAKIQKYQHDLEIQRRDTSRQVNEIRIQLEREQETKKLLMNKLSLYS